MKRKGREEEVYLTVLHYTHLHTCEPCSPPPTAYCVAKVPEAAQATSTADSTARGRGRRGLEEEGVSNDTHSKNMDVHTYTSMLKSYKATLSDLRTQLAYNTPTCTYVRTYTLYWPSCN